MPQAARSPFSTNFHGIHPLRSRTIGCRLYGLTGPRITTGLRRIAHLYRPAVSRTHNKPPWHWLSIPKICLLHRPGRCSDQNTSRTIEAHPGRPLINHVAGHLAGRNTIHVTVGSSAVCHPDDQLSPSAFAVRLPTVATPGVPSVRMKSTSPFRRIASPSACLRAFWITSAAAPAGYCGSCRSWTAPRWTAGWPR